MTAELDRGVIVIKPGRLKHKKKVTGFSYRLFVVLIRVGLNPFLVVGNFLVTIKILINIASVLGLLDSNLLSYPYPLGKLFLFNINIYFTLG